MHKKLIVFAFGATSVLTAAPALADDQPSKPVKEKMICRAEESTGSIMRKRTCHTKAEWEAIDKANAANAKDALDRRYSGSLQLGSRGDTGISPN